MSWVNYDDVVAQMASAGLLVGGRDALRVDTPKPVRCKTTADAREKRGWYALKTWHAPWGDALIVGSFGVWHGNERNAQKIELPKDGDGKARKLSDADKAAFRKMQADALKAAEAEQQRQHAKAAARANAMWQRLQPTGDSQYLQRKGVTGHGLRYTPTGSAVVPLQDAWGAVHGLQLLRAGEVKLPGGRTKPAKEFWPAGLAKKGHFHQIGIPRDVVLIGEGYATMASGHDATSLPAVVAFDANNLLPVAEAIRKRYRTARILFLADDDALGKCRHADCRARVALAVHPKECPQCGRAHGYTNTGVSDASTAALAVGGGWLSPTFPDEAERIRAWLEDGTKLTDFNDLHQSAGLHLVTQQVEAKLRELGWAQARQPAAVTPSTGAGNGDAGVLKPIATLPELMDRYSLIYGGGGTVFDHQEHVRLTLSDMRDGCIRRELHRDWMESPERRIVRMENVGFDPAGDDPNITCNMWGGWPTTPVPGSCEKLLDILRYLCSGEGPRSEALYQWVLKWLAYPIQHPGAKMKTALVVHGPQGAGKNMIFEAVMGIYGKYGRVISQSAIEDKHNDWASRRLFLIADEVVARSEMFHIKNELKGLITGDWIRINPKHMQAHEERNHCNLVFLSNEAMPVVIEEDDRRHCVIWTPALKDRAFYAAAAAEIANGGIAALHDYLLHLPLEDFHPASLPPMTEAKAELIALGMDHPTAFWDECVMGEVGECTPMVGAASDWYELYRGWCQKKGHSRPVPMTKFINQISRKRQAQSLRKRYLDGQSVVYRSVIVPAHVTFPPDEDERGWITEQVEKFAGRVRSYLGLSSRYAGAAE